jgi:hypothetical protein
MFSVAPEVGLTPAGWVILENPVTKDLHLFSSWPDESYRFSTTLQGFTGPDSLQVKTLSGSTYNLLPDRRNEVHSNYCRGVLKSLLDQGFVQV